MANRKYDWPSIRIAIINDRLSSRQAIARFGFSSRALTLAVRRGDVVLNARQCSKNMTLDELLEFVSGRRTTPKERRYIRRHISDRTGYACSECGLSEWRGRRLTLEVDHRDGNPRNNVLSNLRLLCPNCHCTTDTWRGRNVRK